MRTANENNECMHSKQAKPGQEKKTEVQLPWTSTFCSWAGKNGSSSVVSLSTENVNVLTHWVQIQDYLLSRGFEMLTTKGSSLRGGWERVCSSENF